MMTSAALVRHRLLTGQEIALIDVREEAGHATGHPLFAANLPASRLEQLAVQRLPRRDVPIVVFDAGEGLADRAAARLTGLGYTQVSLLEGGLAGWRAAGYELFIDVNSYAKAFGELVEARVHTPSLPAPDVAALLVADRPPVVLDARRFDEYATMNIPGGISAPGAELLLAAAALAPDPDQPIIVNCAGRTRSLIGAQSLVSAGLPNQVHALRNGTIGWLLAGQTLSHGAQASAPLPDADAIALARRRARAVAYRTGVRHIGSDDLALLAADASRTLYCFDVRQPEAHAAGHPAGFRNYPGGQLVQETDMAAPVRGARILLWDDLGLRADMTASWLAQMGWDVWVLDEARPADWRDGPYQVPLPPLPDVPLIAPSDVPVRLAAGNWLIDLAPSPQYRRGHIAGARFAIRSRLPADLGASAPPLIVTCPDGVLARLAVADLRAQGIPATALAGGTAAWAGEIEAGDGTALSPFADRYRRPYEGTDAPREAMQAYLDWEFGLVAQLERDGTHGFRVVGP
jgi:rhodanese-related sulfurtransferase